MKDLVIDHGHIEAWREAFNVLCGEKIGSGAHRTVFACGPRDDLVVKVESATDRRHANVLEYEFWCDWRDCAKVAAWLAPIECMSSDGRILLQKRCAPLPPDYPLPDRLPSFLTDIKSENFGLLDGRLVCLDYAYTCAAAPTRLRKASW